MASVSQILVSMSQQMYEDIKFITQHNPTQVVDEDTAKMFNNLLSEIRANYPFSQQVLAFETMTPRTLKYKDAMVVLGQLSCLLRTLAADNRRVPQQAEAPSAAAQPQQPEPAPGSAPAWLVNKNSTPIPVVQANRKNAVVEEEEDDSPTVAVPAPTKAPQKQSTRIVQERTGLPHDEELYGPVPPVHLNEDGTVRFSMDE